MFSFPVKLNEPLAAYTWFKIGGPAEYLVVAYSVEILTQSVQEAVRDSIPWTILGGGSNVLISDDGLPGLVIINRVQGISPALDGSNQLMVQSGTPMSMVVNEANRRGLGGLAGFLGIPGTIGGAVFNNSHFQTELIGNFVTSVTILDDAGSKQTLTRNDLDFAYDSSRFHHTHELIAGVTLTLPAAEPGVLMDASKQALLKRRTTQPLELPSSGCMFKNLPPDEMDRLGLVSPSIGAVIDRLGLKGTTIGRAAISGQHANFIVNLGGASAQDVYRLSELVREKVWDTYKVDLEREVFLLGKF